MRRLWTGCLVVVMWPWSALAQDYTAEFDLLTVRPSAQGPEADIGFFAYTLGGLDPGEADARPVTFLFNGGPGASSVYLHMLAAGPVRVDVPGDGSLPAAGAGTVPNQESWLDFTDLVFLDPVGTGVSAARAEEPDANAVFYDNETDIATIGAFIHAWLSQTDRWGAPIVLAGESYGGRRVADLVGTLMTDFDISPDKAILISPALGDMPTDDATRWSLVRPATLLPSYAAAAGAFGLGPVTNQVQTALAEVEAFAVGDYVAGLAQLGRMPADARAAFYGRIADLTGLDPALVARHRGRIDPNTFSKEVLRDPARVLDRYDASRAYSDPMPEARSSPRWMRAS